MTEQNELPQVGQVWEDRQEVKIYLVADFRVLNPSPKILDLLSRAELKFPLCVDLNFPLVGIDFEGAYERGDPYHSYDQNGRNWARLYNSGEFDLKTRIA